MFNSNSGSLPVSIPIGVGGNGNGFGGNTFEDVIALAIIAMIFGWGNGGWGGYGMSGFGGSQGGSGYVSDNYALITDNATLERKIDGVYSGICDSTLALNNTMTNGFAAAQNTMTQGFAGLNTSIVTSGYETRNAITQDTIAGMQNTNAIQAQLAQCCCDNKAAIADVKYTIGSANADTNYNLATQANMLDRTVSDKFCQTNFNNATNTRDIIDVQRADTQAILQKLDAMETNRLREKLEAERDAKYALQGQLDRAQLRTDIVNDVRPCPKPAYITCNPFGCNCQQNVYGTTIA